MNIAFHPYTLFFKADYGSLGSVNYRKGALLRITFDDGLVGYADCHPWVELGDQALEIQLSKLKSLNKTPLLECSCHFARLDAEARARGVSLFEGLKIPLSHQLLAVGDNLGEAIASGVTHFKLKCGKSPEKEFIALQSWIERYPGIRLRLDFNERLTRRSFLKYWENLSQDLQTSIDFIEDPYAYEPSQWLCDQKNLSLPLAADAQAIKALQFPGSQRFIVLKPAVNRTPAQIPAGTQLVVTSYLDHPLGQICAAYTAAKLKAYFPSKVGVCGLLSHKYYLEDAFSHALHTQGPQLFAPSGTGFGFDSLLKEVLWHNL